MSILVTEAAKESDQKQLIDNHQQQISQLNKTLEKATPVFKILRK